MEAHYLTAISEACPPDTWKQIVDRAVKDALDGDSSAREWLAKYLVGKTDGPLVSLQFLAVQERLGHTVEDQIDDEAAELEERAAARREREAWLARVCSPAANKPLGPALRLRFAFPGSSRARNKRMTDTALRQAVANLGWLGKYSPHATRTTGSTRLNEMGYPADWIERQLAHTEPNAVRRTYNHAEHLPERRKMMQAWAGYLDALKNRAAAARWGDGLMRLD